MKVSQALSYTALLTLLNACASGSAGDATLTQDSSSSGIVGSVVGGAMSSTDSSGTFAALPKKESTLFSFIPSAYAETHPACAIPKPGNTGAGCTASGNGATSSYWIARTNCSYNQSPAVWNGVQAYFLSAGTASCSTFPNPGANGTMVKQYVNAPGSTTPSTATRTAADGTVITLDDASANLSNFNGDTLSTLATSGYGTKVTFDGSGARSNLQIAERTMAPGRYDHTIVGNLAISETVGSDRRTLSGNITIYYNLVKIMGTSTLANIVQSNTCCVPISGTITTTYSTGTSVAPTAIGAKIVGKTETLTYKSCGVGSLTNTDGTTRLVNTSTCL